MSPKASRTMTWPTIQVWSLHNTILNYEDQSDNVWPMKRMRWDKWHDWLYRSALCRKQNWIVMIDSMGYSIWRRPDKKMIWLIIQLRSMPKLELNFHDRLDKMWLITKTKQENVVIDWMDNVRYWTVKAEWTMCVQWRRRFLTKTIYEKDWMTMTWPII